ncbi:hypothetical protein Ae201684P_011687 [Aphanomyces euteiches]|nr:hypothetical protein Ae201684P_011687 [Aphanomyces euteiches]
MDIASAAAIVNSINKLENKGKETVKVVVRCRPLFGKELVEGRQSIVTMDLEAAVVSIKCPDSDQLKSFTFDSVYDENTVQRQFYDESGYPLVESIFEGYNGTIFAYGQTGCGKTHTMQGKDNPPELRGVIPHAFDHVFDNINADTEREYMVRATYLEIYNEDIRDLLSEDSNKQKLELKESADGGVYVKDLTEVVVSDVVSINKVMARGFKNRTIGATLMNEGSSRSHSIFTIVVEISEKVNGEEHFRAGKLNLVDLAGSERQSKTGATGARLKEGCKINLSLSALGNVISALVDGKGKHIPYRDSKLTRLLQDSLGGNTKTVMVAAISPADYNFEETLSTLRYANRAKNIKNKPTVNEDPKDAKLREYKAEIELLKQMLAQQTGSTPPTSNFGPLSDRKAATPKQSKTIDEEASYVNDRPTTPQNRLISSPKTNVIQRSATEREREFEVKSQELQEQIQREKDELQRQLRLEQDAIEKAKADAAAMMEMARKMMADVQNAPPPQRPNDEEPLYPNIPRVTSKSPSEADSSILSLTMTIESPNAHLTQEILSNPREQERTVDSARIPAITETRSTAQEEQEFKELKEKELNQIREEELRRIKELEETQAKAAEMMQKAQKMMQEAEARASQPPKVKIVKEVVEVVREFVPEGHVKEKEALKEMNQTILNHRDQMARELEETQLAMENHLREKSELASKLEKIGSQICGKNGISTADAELAVLKQQVEFRRTQIKLKMKKKKEVQFEIAKRALQAEKQSVEEELKLAQEQAQVNIAAYKKKQSKWQLPRIKPRGDFTNMKLPALGGSPAGFTPIDRPFSGGETGGAEVCTTDTPVSYRSNKSRSKTRGKIESRGEDNGMELLPLNDLNRLVSIPGASKSTRKEPKDEDDTTQKKSSSSKKREKKKKEKQRDDIQNNGINSLSNSLEPLIHADEAPLDTDMLVYPADDYQPRDRLQSRQGSRQGRRVADTKSSGLGETEDRPQRRRRKSQSKEGEDPIKDDQDSKKKKKKKDKDRKKTPPTAAALDENIAPTLPAPSPEDPDNEDMWEGFP